MQKKLISGLFWVLLANLLVKPFWILGIDVGVQNAVGVEMYGFYFTIFNISYIFNIILDLGITNFNTRNIAQHPRLIAKHLPALLSIKLMLLLLYLAVTFSVGLIKGFSSTQFLMLAILSFNQFLSSLILYLRSNFEALLLFKWDSLLSILDRVLMIIICGFMLWGPIFSIDTNASSPAVGRFTIFHFALAQTVAYLITAAIALTVLIRQIKHKFSILTSHFSIFNFHWNWPFTIAILKQSLPFALLVLLMATYNRIDPILLEQLSPDSSGNFNAGIYAGAFKLLDALTMIAYLVSVPLLPIYSKMTKESAIQNPQSKKGKQKSAIQNPKSAIQNPQSKIQNSVLSTRSTETNEISETTLSMFSLIMVFAITAACTLSALGHDLMALFYNTNIDNYTAVFRILIFCIIPISFTYIFGTLLTAGGYLRQLNIFAACSLVANIAVNIILIPRLGAVGSAWAGLTAQSLMAVAQLIAATVIFKIGFSKGYIIKLLLFSLSVIALTRCTPYMSWWLSLIVCTVAAIAMALLLKLINLKEIIITIKSK